MGRLTDVAPGSVVAEVATLLYKPITLKGTYFVPKKYPCSLLNQFHFPSVPSR